MPSRIRHIDRPPDQPRDEERSWRRALRDKFKPELADDMKVGDMSVTFKRGRRLQSAGRAARSILPIL
jgi:hypothetical protein